MPIIKRTCEFDHCFSKMTNSIQRQALKCLNYLRENPKHPSLQTHKVQGTNFIEAYVNDNGVRILFTRSKDTIILKYIGYHDILKNL